MTKKTNKENNSQPSIEEKIASIGNFVTPSPVSDGTDGEVVGGKPLEKETPGPEGTLGGGDDGETPEGITGAEYSEKIPELTPEQIKERILKVVSEIASQGMTDSEKENFIKDFKFWNGTIFEILDIGNSLKTIAGQATFSLTPGQALLVYVVATGALVVALRGDLQKKIFAGTIENRHEEKNKPDQELSGAENDTKTGVI